MTNTSILKTYYDLTKPGIIRGNLLSLVAGFFLASQTNIDMWLLLAVISGVICVIAGGCVYNNYLDRGIDKKMSRTKKRAIVTGEVSTQAALVYATTLSVVGLGILGYGVNLLTMLLGLIGLFFYTIVYGYAKRTSIHSTLIGSIPGAIPPVAGYTAVTGHLDVAAGLLFLILVCWQMPHFYAISIYRRKEYAAAGLPVLSVVKGLQSTKVQIVIYMAAFVVAASLLTITSYTGIVYLIGCLFIGLYWLSYGMKGFKTKNDERWAKGVFGISLLVLLTWSLLIFADILLP